MDMGKTQRGFAYGTFQDRYGSKCRIQKSSIGTEDAIWLGVETAFNGKDSESMHLTRPMVARLLPMLQHFVVTGELPMGDEQMDAPDLAAVITQNIRLKDIIDQIGYLINDTDSIEEDLTA